MMNYVSIRCPRCNRQITSRGASHERSGSQWECSCGYIEQDTGQGRSQPAETAREFNFKHPLDYDLDDDE